MVECPECGALVPVQPVIVEAGYNPNHFCVMCGKTPTQAGKLIVGRHGAICPDCADLIVDIIKQPIEST